MDQNLSRVIGAQENFQRRMLAGSVDGSLLLLSPLGAQVLLGWERGYSRHIGEISAGPGCVTAGLMWSLKKLIGHNWADDPFQPASMGARGALPPRWFLYDVVPAW